MAVDWLTFEVFEGRVDQTFEATVGDGVVALKLIEATEGTELGGPGPEGQERLQFSLVFRGPLTPVLPQATYPVSHPDLGDLDLFLVPLGPDAEGMRYQAVFA